MYIYIYIYLYIVKILTYIYIYIYIHKIVIQSDIIDTDILISDVPMYINILDVFITANKKYSKYHIN